MSTSIIVEVINGRDNKFGIQFSDDNGPIDLVTTGVNRIIIDYDGTDLDTDDVGVTTGAGGNVDWITDGANGTVIFELGTLATPIATGNYICSAIIYDSTNTNGQEWIDIFQMNVKPTKVG